MSAVIGAARADFDRLYRRHVASVYRYAYAVLGNQADAEDVTQQTFLNAYRAIASGTEPRKAENWLLRIAHNEVRRHFRRTHGKPREVTLDDELPEVPAEATEPSVADLVRALQQLPPLQRSALVMREFEGRSHAEIAGTLEVTQPALEALLFRARRGLSACLEGTYAGARRRRRSLLKGLSVVPIPASLVLFRAEPAAAAGFGGAAAAGGSTVAAGGGLSGFTTAFAAKAAAVAATVGVAGGVGYTVTRPQPVPKATPKAATAPATSVSAAQRDNHRVLAATAPTRRRGVVPKLRRAAPAPAAGTRRQAPANVGGTSPRSEPATMQPPAAAEPPTAAEPEPRAEKVERGEPDERTEPRSPGTAHRDLGRLKAAAGTAHRDLGRLKAAAAKTKSKAPKETELHEPEDDDAPGGARADDRDDTEKEKPEHGKEEDEERAPAAAPPVPVPTDLGGGEKKKG